MSINNSVAKLWQFFHNNSIESADVIFPKWWNFLLFVFPPGQNRFSWDPESSNVCAETAKNPNISIFGRALFCLRPEELAGMFLFRFSAILRWPAKVKQLSRVPTKTFKDQNCVFYKKKISKSILEILLEKTIATLFSCAFGIILDLSVTSETFANWIKFRRKYKYTKKAIGH